MFGSASVPLTLICGTEPIVDCVITELVMSLVESHTGILPLVPPAVVTGVFPVTGDCVREEVKGVTGLSGAGWIDMPVGGAASMNADGGNPPTVSASAAFRA